MCKLDFPHIKYEIFQFLFRVASEQFKRFDYMKLCLLCWDFSRVNLLTWIFLKQNTNEIRNSSAALSLEALYTNWILQRWSRKIFELTMSAKWYVDLCMRTELGCPLIEGNSNNNNSKNYNRKLCECDNHILGYNSDHNNSS